jgi:hypothetical protein
MRQMPSRLPRRTRYAVVLVIATVCLHQQSIERASAQADAGASPIKRSGYTLGQEICGQAPMAFPKVGLGMRPGYCAGLVASKEDGLVFPRSIVQVPNSNLFVVADMGGFDDPNVGRLLAYRPGGTENSSILSTVLGSIPYRRAAARLLKPTIRTACRTFA